MIVGGDEEGGLLDAVSPLPNQRRLRCPEGSSGPPPAFVLLSSALFPEESRAALSASRDGGRLGSRLDVISTSSASRHHLRRLV